MEISPDDGFEKPWGTPWVHPWDGVPPGIARIAETHAAMGRLPAPQLPERALAIESPLDIYEIL